MLCDTHLMMINVMSTCRHNAEGHYAHMQNQVLGMVAVYLDCEVGPHAHPSRPRYRKA